MLVYLAGPINGCTDEEANDWRSEATELLKPHRVADPMVRDYRGKELGNVAAIVDEDKRDISFSSAVLAYCPTPSVGTSMEIFYAWDLGLSVATVVPNGVAVSPWLSYHSSIIVATVSEAVDYLKG